MKTVLYDKAKKKILQFKNSIEEIAKETPTFSDRIKNEMDIVSSA